MLVHTCAHASAFVPHLNERLGRGEVLHPRVRRLDVFACVVLSANKPLKRRQFCIFLHRISINLLAIYTPEMLIAALLHSQNN